jgi:hypothetical protein
MISSATCQPVCLDGVPPIPTSRRISKGVSNSVQALPDDQGLHEEIIVYSTPGDKDREKFIDKATGTEMEQAAEPQPLLEWFAEKYKEFGATLEFVTNKSQEGSQFVKGCVSRETVP